MYWGAGALVALLVLIFSVGGVFIDKGNPVDDWLIAALAFACILGIWRSTNGRLP